MVDRLAVDVLESVAVVVHCGFFLEHFAGSAQRRDVGSLVALIANRLHRNIGGHDHIGDRSAPVCDNADNGRVEHWGSSAKMPTRARLTLDRKAN